MEKTLENKNEINNKNQKSISCSIRICGVSIWRIIGYFVVYSFIGFLAEVLYALITKGVIESRQSIIYGPFCLIYGVGAILIILPIKQINSKNKFVNFIVPAIIGSVFEYFVSWFGETFLHIKWWDYTGYFLNINGRICLYYSIFWGVLGYLLTTKINPKIDALFDKFRGKLSARNQDILLIIVIVLFVLDFACSIIATDYYQTRTVVEKGVNVSPELKEYYNNHYNEIYGDPDRKERIMSIWGNDVMLKTYPNLKMDNASGDSVYLSTYYPDIPNYYFKVFDVNSINFDDMKRKIDNARELVDKPINTNFWEE